MGTVRRFFPVLIAACALAALASCTRTQEAQPAQAGPARNLVLITIDTLRTDRVGAYGHTRARTPAIDGLAARGVRFERAFATAPITLPSHASMMTGRYPPGHGGRHNGMRIKDDVPVLAETLGRAGFTTGAFVSAFPLDRRFGLERGFKTYSDRMPRTQQGRLANERPGRVAVDEAIAWLQQNRTQRFFLWLHLFEPHAPYGEPGDRRPVDVRYDEEIAEADRQVARVLEALGPDRDATLVMLTADHGEAFGEHGEIGHSIFVYDTTLRVPLVVAGPSISAAVVGDPVSLVDIAPTAAALLGVPAFDADGITLASALAGGGIPSRDLYAESFAPLLDFGWSPLRSVRTDDVKYISAPKPELFEIASDPAEERNLAGSEMQKVAALEVRVERVSPARLDAGPTALDRESAGRLQALGYVSGGPAGRDGVRPDPKDRRELAARLAQVTSGELQGAELESALRAIIKDDPGNPQAHLRLGYVFADSNRCRAAESHFEKAIAGRAPTADAHLGLARCLAERRAFDRAVEVLREGAKVEPANPVVLANQGVLLSGGGNSGAAVAPLREALKLDPDFHEARFNLAVALADLGQREEAASEARELLQRLPSSAPQRSEVERLLAKLR